MATLKTLIPYLSQGCTLVSAIEETLTPSHNGKVTWQRPESRRRGWPEPIDRHISQIASMATSFDWGVLFWDSAMKRDYAINSIEAIDAALERKTPHYVFGKVE